MGEIESQIRVGDEAQSHNRLHVVDPKRECHSGGGAGDREGEPRSTAVLEGLAFAVPPRPQRVLIAAIFYLLHFGCIAAVKVRREGQARRERPHFYSNEWPFGW